MLQTYPKDEEIIRRNALNFYSKEKLSEGSVAFSLTSNDASMEDGSDDSGSSGGKSTASRGTQKTAASFERLPDTHNMDVLGSCEQKGLYVLLEVIAPHLAHAGRHAHVRGCRGCDRVVEVCGFVLDCGFERMAHISPEDGGAQVFPRESRAFFRDRLWMLTAPASFICGVCISRITEVKKINDFTNTHERH